MVERLRSLKRPPIELSGHAAILTSRLLRREVTVNLGEKRFVVGRVDGYNPPDNLSVTLVRCRLHEPCVHGLPGLDVYQVDSRRFGIDRIKLKI